ncbi:cyclic nucleotide-binding domain-containing protein [Hymenobacter sp. GOD-10R]|uniref:cyclic nucleotide-binding domain-containing protein n=1 Tax=Hymenobacter sp. GOD-10R TaxID=3093922 RepID=UPI002D767D71|nr:cyclic nucleotide-binding domain-containing protein [Hymenobacter sp. GOD-10R]WRQ28999.1 cyclic nucleotide-binding domain-containing protein [Hymenobacter sp. GOD-10R]
MTLLERWQQLVGIRPDEGRTVGLFFLHNFLLGIGTILVYVSANVILLETNPERNLPLAYGVAALAMMGASKIYGHYEHHLSLQRLAARVLLSVVVVTGVLGVLITFGHSVAAAVAIMAGYRVIYLLTNLEFWGVSAVVFDVRQGRRLFSVISSGDMPAKALGAVLAILIHHHSDLLWLLLTAFAAYLGALLTLQATGRLHDVEVRAAARAVRTQALAPELRKWFGDSRLVLTLCLSLTAIAAVTTGVEYSFFVNVKHKFHDQASVMQYVGSVLVLTYLLASLFKLLFSHTLLSKLGIRWMLITLPIVVLASLLLFGGLWIEQVEESILLLYFCGLYLVLEVLRRAIFDPVFLVLFQPMSAPERLQAHTLVKGFYEPLGMALGGGLLFALHFFPALSQWAPFAWMGLFMAGAIFFLHRTYGHYLSELQHALSRRFTTDTEADGQSWSEALGSRQNGTTALSDGRETKQLIAALTDKNLRHAAADQLVQLGEAAVPELATVLQTSPDETLVRRVALVCGQIRVPASRSALLLLVQQPNLARREIALRALRSFGPVAADAPLFEGLILAEMKLAQVLLHGQATTDNAPLTQALDYELSKVQQRIFGLLFQLYSPQLIADAQRGVTHATRERQANALEMLDNVIARPVYLALQTLFEVAPVRQKVRAFTTVIGSMETSEPVLDTIIRCGEATFSDWTVSVALRQWHPQAATSAELLPYLGSKNLLIQESAFAVLDQLSEQEPTLYQSLLAAHPTLTSLRMSHHATTSRIPATERVSVLKNTALFAATPENVLSSIVPIMKEVTFHDEQQVFAKGDLGASLFIVYKGEVGVFSGAQHLATFRKGDFFGELALLDAEPRSATAVAKGDVVAFRLDQEDFYDVMEERSEVLRNIMRVLCQRLRRQNEKTMAAPPSSVSEG